MRVVSLVEYQTSIEEQDDIEDEEEKELLLNEAFKEVVEGPE